MVRDFQAVIGREARAQILEAEGRLPDALVACVGGGSNAIGLFHPFLDDAGVQHRSASRRRARASTPAEHAAALNGGRPGVLHGNMTYLLQDGDGQITEAHSISAGLDYPGIGPEHAWLHDVGRVDLPDRHRRRGAGRLPAAAPSSRASCRRSRAAHALAAGRRRSRRRWRKDGIWCVNLSGRGDKDIFTVADGHLGREL